jgi:hypothetical protein
MPIYVTTFQISAKAGPGPVLLPLRTSLIRAVFVVFFHGFLKGLHAASS